MTAQGMNALGFDAALGLVRIAGVLELFPPRSLVASYAAGMITVTRVATGRALICAPPSRISGLDGSEFADGPTCLAYLTWALAERPPGDPVLVAMAAVDLSGQRAVRALPDGRLVYASGFAAADRGAVLGLTAAAGLVGTPVDVVTAGPLTSPGWGLTPDRPLYLGAGGLVTQTPPAAPAPFVLRLGHALDPDTALIRVGSPITLAPT